MRVPWLAVMLVSLAVAPGQAAEGPPLVAVVFGEHSFNESPGGEGGNARTFCDTVKAALDGVGVRYTDLKDSEVEAGALAAYRVAVFPYNFAIPLAEEGQIRRYLGQGGKVVFCYAIPDSIAARIGIRHVEHVAGDLHTIRLHAPEVKGLPTSVQQASWNIERMEAAAADVRVIGEWYDARGNALNQPALFLSPRGAYMSHVLTAADLTSKGRMLVAILGWLEPALWPETAGRAIAASAAKLDLVSTRLRAGSLPEDARQEAERRLAAQHAKLQAAERNVAAGQYVAALGAAAEVAQESVVLYGMSSAERRHEFRGTWIHDAYGVPGGWGWERSIRELRDHGFNAILPNMLWAGLAHYPSKVLPVSPEVEQRGDQIAECLRWCQQYGVELHVWKVNYNLATAPEEFVSQLRAEGRLQKHRDGSEVRWLCPSDPRNFALERDSMLEVVRNYAVDGIHFDYIRYPHDQSCYCDGCRQRFEQTIGGSIADWPEEVTREPLRPRWDQWRREQVTNLVRAVATQARRIRPGIMISAAVFNYPSSLDWVNQDWKTWMDEGLLDFVCPMDYTADAGELERIVAHQVEVVAGKIPLYPGIGEFIISDARGLLDQMERARRLGADGFTLFCYEHMGPDESRMASLHVSHTLHPTRPPHPAPRVVFDLPQGIPDQPTLTYGAGEGITVAVTLTAQGNYPQPIARASAEVSVETTEGARALDLGPIASADEHAKPASFTLPPGRYRLAVTGTAILVSGTERQFVVRSRPFAVVGGG